MARRMLLLTGIAEGLGAAIAETFAAAGHDVIGLSRSTRSSEQMTRRVEAAGGKYRHLACDITRTADVTAAIKPHADRIDVLIHNPQLLTVKPFEQTTTDEFEQAWRVACLGAVIAAQAVIPHMAARQQGMIILTGATAGLRGGANFSAFASAKFALRGLALALSREYGPKGVHVAHVALDGLIDEPQTDARFGSQASGRMDPRSIAQTYLDLSTQPPSTWTHEMDLRPFSERFWCARADEADRTQTDRARHRQGRVETGGSKWPDPAAALSCAGYRRKRNP
jgi:NAD(P)-dependent dehydrogenase (short-subunit alcohol dehydrogenase family)